MVTIVLISLGTGVLVAIIMFFISDWLTSMRERLFGKRRKLSYSNIFEAVGELCDQIKNGADQRIAYDPDHILGIDWGGCVIAAILAQSLKKPTAVFEGNRDPDPMKPTFPKDPESFEKLKGIINGKKVLLVDDLSIKSGTLKRAREALSGIASDIKIAAISIPHPKRWPERGIEAIYNYDIKKYRHKFDRQFEFPWKVWEA